MGFLQLEAVLTGGGVFLGLTVGAGLWRRWCRCLCAELLEGEGDGEAAPCAAFGPVVPFRAISAAFCECELELAVSAMKWKAPNPAPANTTIATKIKTKGRL